jgi:hypothetical protein
MVATRIEDALSRDVAARFLLVCPPGEVPVVLDQVLARQLSVELSPVPVSQVWVGARGAHTCRLFLCLNQRSLATDPMDIDYLLEFESGRSVRQALQALRTAASSLSSQARARPLSTTESVVFHHPLWWLPAPKRWDSGIALPSLSPATDLAGTMGVLPEEASDLLLAAGCRKRKLNEVLQIVRSWVLCWSHRLFQSRRQRILLRKRADRSTVMLELETLRSRFFSNARATARRLSRLARSHSIAHPSSQNRRRSPPPPPPPPPRKRFRLSLAERSAAVIARHKYVAERLRPRPSPLAHCSSHSLATLNPAAPDYLFAESDRDKKHA